MARRLFTRRLVKFSEIPRITIHNRYSTALLMKTCFNDSNTRHVMHCSQVHFSTNRPNAMENKAPNNEKPEESGDKPAAKLTLFQRFKQMYRDYWYVLVPVHVVTSGIWFGGFYYIAKSGVDVVAIMESLNVSEKFTNHLRDSKMGYVAISYALYKISTPLRYTVTLGGTTISINYLKQWGYIKPVPSAQKLKEMYHERKDNLIETLHDKTEGLMQRTEQLKDKKDDIIEDLKNMKRIKNHVLVKKKDRRD